MKKIRLLIMLAMAISLGVTCTSTRADMHQDIPRITKDELKANLNNKEFVIVDVRIPKDYDNSNSKIVGAIRENPMDVTFWAPYPKNKTIVLYCA